MLFLTIDITAIIISAIGAVVSISTVALTLVIKSKVNSIHNDVNGKMAQLLEAKETAAGQTGKLEAIAVTHPELKDLSKAAATHALDKETVLDVKIVDQDKSVKVTETPDKK